MLNRMTGLLAAAGVAACLGAVAQAELIDFEEPTYSDATPGPALDGQDGWTADSGWVLGDGPAAPNTTQVMRNDGDDSTAYTAERTFAVPSTAGVLSYDVRPSAATPESGGQPVHWLLPQGSNGAWLFQIRVFSDLGFKLIHGGGNTNSADLTDIEFSSGDAWYNIEAVFDIADLTGGANGTFDLEITRLDGAFAGTVVWDIDDQAIANAVPDLAKWRDHSSYATAGHDTLIDNINLVTLGSNIVEFTEVDVPDTVALEFDSELGVTYRLEAAPAAEGPFADQGLALDGDGDVMWMFDPTEPIGLPTSKFYRISSAE